MVHKFELPKWLIRGIEESFPLKNSEQTLAYKIHDANKNKTHNRDKRLNFFIMNYWLVN